MGIILIFRVEMNDRNPHWKISTDQMHKAFRHVENVFIHRFLFNNTYPG